MQAAHQPHPSQKKRGCAATGSMAIASTPTPFAASTTAPQTTHTLIAARSLARQALHWAMLTTPPWDVAAAAAVEAVAGTKSAALI